MLLPIKHWKIFAIAGASRAFSARNGKYFSYLGTKGDDQAYKRVFKADVNERKKEIHEIYKDYRHGLTAAEIAQKHNMPVEAIEVYFEQFEEGQRETEERIINVWLGESTADITENSNESIEIIKEILNKYKIDFT